jgi:cell division protein FtsB
MREFQAKKKEQATFNRILNSKWSLLVLGIVLFFLIRGNIRIIKNYFYVKEEYTKDLESYKNLQEREVEITKDIERLNTESGLDYEIRKKLDVSKEDEKVIKIIDNR